MASTPIITHSLVAVLGQQIDANVQLMTALGADVVTQGKGRDDRYLIAASLGLEAVATHDGVVQAIFFKAKGVEGSAGYAEDLPNGLAFSNSRNDVRQNLATPAMSGEAGGEGIMAIAHSWDRFEDGKTYLRCEYEAGDTHLRMITMGLV
jgi:hypothetical protein